MKRDPTYCASCEHFPLAASVEAKGRAVCPWFEQERSWNYPACVLHNRSKDVDARKRIVIVLAKAEKPIDQS